MARLKPQNSGPVSIFFQLIFLHEGTPFGRLSPQLQTPGADQLREHRVPYFFSLVSWGLTIVILTVNLLSLFNCSHHPENSLGSRRQAHCCARSWHLLFPLPVSPRPPERPPSIQVALFASSARSISEWGLGRWMLPNTLFSSSQVSLHAHQVLTAEAPIRQEYCFPRPAWGWEPPQGR